MTTTRKEVLIKKYMEFQVNVHSIIGENSFFPSLDDIDVVDMLIYFNMFFHSITDYHTVLKDMMYMNNVKVSDEDYILLYPVISGYIDWMKKFQSN